MESIGATGIIDARRNNVRVLVQQLDAARERFRIGEFTITDVSQPRPACQDLARSGNKGHAAAATNQPAHGPKRFPRSPRIV